MKDVVYSAFVSRQLSYEEPAAPAVHILSCCVAGFELDGKRMIRQGNGTYVADDGTWHSERKHAVADAIKILEVRMAEFAKAIEALRKEEC